MEEVASATITHVECVGIVSEAPSAWTAFKPACVELFIVVQVPYLLTSKVFPHEFEAMQAAYIHNWYYARVVGNWRIKLIGEAFPLGTCVRAPY